MLSPSRVVMIELYIYICFEKFFSQKLQVNFTNKDNETQVSHCINILAYFTILFNFILFYCKKYSNNIFIYNLEVCMHAFLQCIWI